MEYETIVGLVAVTVIVTGLLYFAYRKKSSSGDKSGGSGNRPVDPGNGGDTTKPGFKE